MEALNTLETPEQRVATLCKKVCIRANRARDVGTKLENHHRYIRTEIFGSILLYCLLRTTHRRIDGPHVRTSLIRTI